MADVKSDDLYKRLGVARDTTDKQIATAYKKSALKYHPDKNPNGEEDFKRVTEAYEVLSDKEKRKQYDQFGVFGGNAPAGQAGQPGPGANYFTTTSGGADFAHFDSIFKNFFGGDPFSNDADDNPMSMFGMNIGGMGHPMMGGMNGMGGMSGMNGMGGMSGMNGMCGMNGMGGMNGTQFQSFGNSGQRMKRTRDRDAYDIIQDRTQVVVQNLQSSPELNGQVGSISGYDQHKGRYDVSVALRTVALKPSKLVICANVTITGITSKPEMNGETGQICGFDRGSERYTVKVSSRSNGGSAPVMKLLTSNVILSSGTRVMVVNLQNAKVHNYSWGTIMNYDAKDERYVVCLADGKKTLRLKRENCRCAG